MKKLMLLSGCLGLTSIVPLVAQAQTTDAGLEAAITMYGVPVLSANPDILNSTANDSGPWGAKEFLYSLNNDVGPLGSPEFLNSVSNEYGTGLKIDLIQPILDLDAP